MPLYVFTIGLLIISVATGYARFSGRPSDDSALLSALFIGSTAGVLICLVRLASSHMERIGRSISNRQDMHRDA